MSRLGAPKEIEKLARSWRRVGGTVEITGGNHIRWELGEICLYTGLSPSKGGEAADIRKVRCAMEQAKVVVAPSTYRAECQVPGCKANSDDVPHDVAQAWATTHAKTHGPDFRVERNQA